MTRDLDARARVVIVGGGFGGLTAAQALANAPVQITLVDRNEPPHVPAASLSDRRGGPLAGGHRAADPFHPAPSGERDRSHGGRGRGRRPGAACSPQRRERARIRFLDRRVRRANVVFRSRRLGRRGAGLEVDRGRRPDTDEGPPGLRGRRSERKTPKREPSSSASSSSAAGRPESSWRARSPSSRSSSSTATFDGSILPPRESASSRRGLASSPRSPRISPRAR